MYATLSLKRLVSLIGTPLVAILLIILYLQGLPTNAASTMRMMSLAVTVCGVILFAAFGFSGRWSPWRILWFICPPLNQIFPDLNGTWRGKTRSNWSVIERLVDSATGKVPPLQRQDLSGIPLQENDIELTIIASLFTFRIQGKLSSTNGSSYSVTERVQKNNVRNCFELFYLYLQHTPEPLYTDEGSHPGAARLDIDLHAWTLKGEYWNRRSWRSGENAAGLIEVTRVTR